MQKTKVKEAKGFEEKDNFFQGILEKQKGELERLEKGLKEKLKADFGREESQNVYKKIEELLKLCEEKGKNEEALRIMEYDYGLFMELMALVEERAEKKIKLSGEGEKLSESFKKKDDEIEQKLELKRRQVREMLSEAVKKKTDKNYYDKIIGEIVYRRRHNEMNILAVRDLEKERKVGEKLVDQVAAKRLKLAVDYGINMS
jgi:hypothetical protein